MSLSQEQNEALKQWMQAHNAGGKCPACGTNNWTPGDIIAAMKQTKGGVSVGGPTIPMVQVVCTNCMHIILFAAVPIFGEDNL